MKVSEELNDKVVAIFKLLEMEDYYDLLEDDIKAIKSTIPNFDDTFFLLYGEPIYEEVYSFKTEKTLKNFINSYKGKRKFNEYCSYIATHGEKYLFGK